MLTLLGCSAFTARALVPSKFIMPKDLTKPSAHIKARSFHYPGSEAQRFVVPDDKVPWVTEFPEYNPVEYTAPSVEKGPIWADPDIRKPSNVEKVKFNKLDGPVNRQSFSGIYEIVQSLPRNPIGRTGICGRGLLGKWGPNHAADPIVTRWKRAPNGSVVTHPNSKKPILQVVAIQRRDTREWALPGGMVDGNEKVSVTLKREFSEEALNSLEASDEEKAQIAKRIDNLFKHGVEVYKGYVDDPRNTDNAWMETVAVNFHDDTGDSAGKLPLEAGDDAGAVRWMDLNGKMQLYASHAKFVATVAENHQAHWLDDQ